MELEDFVVGLNDLKYKMSENGKAGYEGSDVYQMTFNRGNKVIIVVTDIEELNKVNIVQITDNKSGGYVLLRGSDVPTLEDVYKLIYKYDDELKGRYMQETINRQLNEIYDGDNPVELYYNGSEITYTGVVSEEELYSNLSLMEQHQENNGRVLQYIEAILLLREGYSVLNTSTAEDVGEFIGKVKEYLVRYNKMYGTKSDDEILEYILQRGVGVYDTPESVIKNIYDFPVLDSRYGQEETDEIIREMPKDTAKKIRKKLKEKFKGVKFSVKTDTRAVRVSWEDFPNKSKVEEVLNLYNGKHTQQTYGDYGNDNVDAGYIDPDDGKRYQSPEYFFTNQSFSEKYKEMLEYAVESRLVNTGGLDASEYSYLSSFYQSRIRREPEDNEQIRDIESYEEVDELYKHYKAVFNKNFKRAVEADLKKLDVEYRYQLKNVSLNKENKTELNIITTQGNETSIKEKVLQSPVIKGYNVKINVKVGSTGTDNKKPIFKENPDGRDNERLKRFVQYLKGTELKYKQGDNKKLPNYVVVDIGGMTLSFAPTFVVDVKNKQQIYNKHNDLHNFGTLVKGVGNIAQAKKLNTKTSNQLYKLLEAYNTSNDLRKKT